MHDMLEGVCMWELKLVIKHLVTSGTFTLAKLNERITSFDYGFQDASNKPNCINDADIQKPFNAAGQNASQSWCLMRHFCLMMGDLVEVDNEYWEVIVLLLQCMDMIFSPGITREDTYFLKHLIRDHHELYLQVFEEHLRPKHHFMVHYPNAIRFVGPLRQFWTFRFEAKHNFLKQLAHLNCNFKNIAKSLAKRHQFQLCQNMITERQLGSSSLEVGPGSSVLLVSLDNAEVISQALGGYPLYDDLFLAKWIRLFGITYRKGMIVAIGKTDVDLEPLFGKIIQVVILEESRVKLVVQRWENEGFSRHLHAYVVTPGDPTEVIAMGIDDLVDFNPLHATKAYMQDDMWYICPRYKIA
nr:uncharacterized protein LOC129284158 [Lytechinus pictus]